MTRSRDPGARSLRAWLAGEGLGPFLVRSVAGSGAVRIFGMAASFVAGVLLARGLGVEGYGYYSLALAVITIAAIPGEMGLPVLVTREVAAASAKDDNAKLLGMLRWADRTTIWLGGGVALLVGLAGAALYGQVSAELAGALILGAPVIPLIALAKTRGAALQGLNHVVRGQVPWSLLRPLLLALLVGGLLATGTKLTAPAAMALNSVTAAMVLAVAFVWLRQRLPQARPAQLADSGKGWLASAIPMGLMEGMRVLQIEVALLLVGMIAAPALVGLLRIASVTAMMAASAMSLILTIAMPILSRLFIEGDRNRLQNTTTAFAHAQFLGVAVVAVPILIFPTQLIEFAFSGEYAPAANALRILTLGQVANAAFGPNATVLVIANHERRATRAMAIGLGVTTVMVPVLCLGWGLTGAASGIVASLMCWNVITWRDAKRLVNIETSIISWPWSRGSDAD